MMCCFKRAAGRRAKRLGDGRHALSSTILSWPIVVPAPSAAQHSAPTHASLLAGVHPAQASKQAPPPPPGHNPHPPLCFTRVATHSAQVHEVAVPSAVARVLLVLPAGGLPEVGHRAELGADRAARVEPPVQRLRKMIGGRGRQRRKQRVRVCARRRVVEVVVEDFCVFVALSPLTSSLFDPAHLLLPELLYGISFISWTK